MLSQPVARMSLAGMGWLLTILRRMILSWMILILLRRGTEVTMLRVNMLTQA
jgi:hypothetical protein